MKFKSKKVTLAVAQALGIGGAIAIIGTPALAQDVRITVTGSSIKRVESEGALPVITLDRTYIEQSGLTTATQLIESLPSMQNFVAPVNSVNGGGGGVATAALHAMPSKYTLVLVNGQRTASLGIGNAQGGGNGVSINSIPLAAVERVEILTDGASAIYGSDAIAGVVNFILKKTETEGQAFAQWTRPEGSGGGGWNAGISKGFGDLDKDKWNFMFTFEHNEQFALEASQRDFSNPGAYRTFSQNGINYRFNQATSNTEPANIQSFSAYPKGGSPSQAKFYSINPYYAQNGNCGNPGFISAILDPTGTGVLAPASGVSCRFNYAATVMDIPSNEQNAVTVNGTWKLNDTTTAYANYNFSQNTINSAFAAPAQPFGINPTTRVPTLYNNYVQPFLDANNLTIVQPKNPSAPWATVGYRGVSLGRRTDDFETTWNHAAAGIDGRAWNWDYTARLTFAQTELKDSYVNGYSDSGCVNAAIAANKYDPVLGTGADSVRSCVLNTVFADTKSRLTDLHLTAQHDVWDLGWGGGMSIFAAGFDYLWNSYDINYGPYGLVGSGYSTQDDFSATAIGGNGGQVPISAHRNNWAIYGELLLPVLKNLEFDASVRYDYYNKIHSGYVFGTTAVNDVFPQVAAADLGNSFNDTTYKITGRWTPLEKLLIRGSYGTGFKAPSLSDVAGPEVFGGSTVGSYTCPFPGTSGCIPGSAQYDLTVGPNGQTGALGLQAEKSTQWTVGARWDGIRGLTLGADWWDVKISQQIQSAGINEAIAFANPQQYVPLGLWVNPYVDPVGGFNTIALRQVPFNGPEAEYQGLDWDVGWRTDVPWWNLGVFSLNWTGTQIFKAKYQLAPGTPFLSSLGQFGPDNAVVFRTTMQLIMNLATGPWNNNLTMHYKSGYEDQSYLGGSPAAVFFLNPDGTQGPLATSFDRLHVPSYTTFDYQLSYNMAKGDKNNPVGFPMKFTFGVLNLFDKDPPFTLQIAGAGNSIGYDGRYADPTGRAYYVRGELRF